MGVSYAPIALSFGLSAEPLSVSVNVGGSVESLINVSAKGNPVDLPVDLSASSVAGVTTTFDPQQVIMPPSVGEWHSNQSTLIISAGGSAISGVYVLTVYADFGLETLNVNITLTILETGGRNTVGGRIASDDNPLDMAPYIALTGAIAAATVCIALGVRKKHED
jgi:hypothetical protein